MSKIRSQPGPVPILRRHGEFYGRPERKATVGGFAIADMEPDPHLVVQRHTHDVAHFIFLIAGPYVTAARGAPSICLQPTLIYNPPGTTHRDRFEPIDGWVRGRFLAVSVAAERLVQVAEQVTLPEEPVCLPDTAALAIAARITRECRNWERSSPLMAEALCLELSAYAAGLGPNDSPSAPGWLRQARAMLRDLCAESVSVGDIARECSVHPVHLARMFRRFFNCSPGDYVRRCRLERAAALLAGTRQTLGEVALASGFADQSHMSHAFRRAYRVTPGEYRRLSGISWCDPEGCTETIQHDALDRV
jgi:AraC family transcriptional regulator